MVFYFCDICDFLNEDKWKYQTHLKTKKHLRRTESLAATGVNWGCKRCNSVFLDEVQRNKHLNRNEFYFLPQFSHRKCNEFNCLNCDKTYDNCKSLQTHQGYCSSNSKYNSNMKKETKIKEINKLEKLKKLYAETGSFSSLNNVDYKINMLKEHDRDPHIEGDAYPEDDWYNKYDWITAEDWEIEETDHEILSQTQKIYYRNKPYYVDGLYNAFNKKGECIGGFE